MELQAAYQKLFDYMSQRVPLKADELELMKNYYHLRKVNKKDFFLKEGSKHFQQGFVVQGTLRVFYTDAKGNEHVLYFRRQLHA
jgi:hypothetical protein